MRPFLTLHDPETAKAYYDAGLWSSETFYALLLGHAAEHPDRTALRDGCGTLTWAALIDRVDAFADQLAEDGLVAGDRMSLWMSNRAEAVIAFLACSREGIACNPSLHRTHTAGEVATLLAAVGSSALLVQPGWGDSAALEARLGEVPALRKVYAPDALPQARRGGSRRFHANPDTIAYLAFTSGTTGMPKCVMHSSNTLLANARDLVADWAVGPETVLLTLSPLSHHIAWVAVGQWLLSGCQLVTDDPPRGTTRLDWIVTTGATYVMGVPTHAMDVLEEQKTRNIPRLGKVRVFYMAGSPIPPVVAQAFLEQGITPQNVYGMTENSSHHYTHPGDDPQTWAFTCGRGGRSYEVRIFDPEDAGRPVAAGEVGQIGGRGAALMLGYFGNQAAIDASFNREGWFLSGDLGSLDADGNLRIEGRLKDLIIRGGHNIYPARIEAIAVMHEGIERAAAFGVADERLGERVCLAIKGTLSPVEVLEHLAAEGLSLYDMPEWFVALDAFPMTASGKILKRELAALVARGELRPVEVRYRPNIAAAS